LTAPSKRAPTLYAIVAIKLLRGIILVMLAVQAFRLVGEDLRPHFEDAVQRLRLDPETDFFDRLGGRIEAITPVNVGWVASGAVLYGTLSLLEGIGLALRWRWAGMLVIIESGFFVPVETYALIKEPSLTITIVLILNVAIVVYLYRNRGRLFRHA
jgi:uncharacterized membrane protein (DUF2068 family)